MLVGNIDFFPIETEMAILSEWKNRNYVKSTKATDWISGTLITYIFHYNPFFSIKKVLPAYPASRRQSRASSITATFKMEMPTRICNFPLAREPTFSALYTLKKIILPSHLWKIDFSSVQRMRKPETPPLNNVSMLHKTAVVRSLN